MKEKNQKNQIIHKKKFGSFFKQIATHDISTGIRVPHGFLSRPRPISSKFILLCMMSLAERCLAASVNNPLYFTFNGTSYELYNKNPYFKDHSGKNYDFFQEVANNLIDGEYGNIHVSPHEIDTTTEVWSQRVCRYTIQLLRNANEGSQNYFEQNISDSMTALASGYQDECSKAINSGVVIGATLGSIFGAALLVIAGILLYWKYSKCKQATVKHPQAINSNEETKPTRKFVTDINLPEEAEENESYQDYFSVRNNMA